MSEELNQPGVEGQGAGQGEGEGQPPLPGVNGEQTTPEAQVSPAVDERGVPWENRAKENERKLRDREAEIERLRNQPPVPVAPPAEQEDEFTRGEREQRELRQQEIQKVLQYERFADDLLEKNLDELVKSRPVAGQFKDQIRRLMRPTRPEFRASKDALRQAMNQVIGDNFDTIVPVAGTPARVTPETPSQRRLAPVEPQVISSTPRGGNETIQLTDEEREFSEMHDLEAKGFTDTEVREMCKNRKEKHKK